MKDTIQEQVKELREMGYSYLNASRYLQKVSYESPEDYKRRWKYNERVAKEALALKERELLKAQLIELQKKLEEKLSQQ